MIETVHDPININTTYETRAYNGKLSPFTKLIYSIDVHTRQRLRYLRAIPYFDRLWQRVQSLLPRYIFRVVHDGSAGQVFEIGTPTVNGTTEVSRTEFWSQGYKQQASIDPDNATIPITNLLRADVAEQIHGHMFGKSKGFASRWISNTDSFELAINRAERHRAAKRSNVVIYIIDTHTFIEPALPNLMFLAFRAWNVNKENHRFIAKYFEYGSLTEWLFWDKIVARDVVKIDYTSFAYPERGLEAGWRPHLADRDLIRRVIDAAQAKAGTSTRRLLHEELYITSATEVAIEKWHKETFAGRCGKLPKAPRVVKSDKRVSIDDMTIEKVWNMVKTTPSRNVLFVWLLSLMTRRYERDSIVEAVIRLHPSVVSDSLETIQQYQQDTSSNSSVKLQVYYLPGRICAGRIDVNPFHDLVKSLIIKLDEVEHKKSPLAVRMPIYFVSEQNRPLRNLIKLSEHGHAGKCKASSVLTDGHMLANLTYEEICKYGMLVKQPETDEELTLRLGHQTFHGPDVKEKSVHSFTVPKGDFARAHERALSKNSTDDSTRKRSNQKINEARLKAMKARRPVRTGPNQSEMTD